MKYILLTFISIISINSFANNCEYHDYNLDFECEVRSDHSIQLYKVYSKDGDPCIHAYSEGNENRVGEFGQFATMYAEDKAQVYDFRVNGLRFYLNIDGTITRLDLAKDKFETCRRVSGIPN